MTKQLAIGLMSGTSLDGIDAVLVEIDGVYKSTRVKMIESYFQAYNQDLKNALLELCEPKTASVDKICSMNMYLGKLFGQTVNQLLKKARITHQDVSFISSHGQTIYHIPEIDAQAPWNIASTLQIADLSAISEETKIAVVGDFRTADMAAGGQGAPLVSFVDYILFHDENKNLAIQNIGGIGNVSYLSEEAKSSEVLSFDTGPGNMVIDAAVQIITKGERRYDENGEIAALGTIDWVLLEELMAHPYLSAEPPKTTGRELFGFNFAQKLIEKSRHKNIKDEDLVATVTAWTARSIAASYKKFLIDKGKPIDEVIIGGGGSYNPTLISYLKEFLPRQKIFTHEDFGISSDLKEAIAFVILGYHTLTGQYNQLPSATGAKHPVIMGKIAYTQPEAYDRIRIIRGMSNGDSL